jgi:hypothetical protein
MMTYLVFEQEDRCVNFRFSTRSKDRAYAVAGQYGFTVTEAELDVEDFEYSLDGLSIYAVQIREGPCAPYTKDEDRQRAWPVTELPKPLVTEPWNGKDPETGIAHSMTIRAKSPKDAIERVLAHIAGTTTEQQDL